MPLKNREKYNNYLKHYRRNKKEIEFTKHKYSLVMAELKKSCILPRHIYDMRTVHTQMLKEYFKKSFIPVRRYTEVIQREIC